MTHTYIYKGIAKAMMTVAVAIGMTACNDSFKGIIGDGYIHTPDPTSPEVIRDRIPLIVSFTDPLYDFYNPSTRAGQDNGMGAFDGWTADKAKWQRAQFHVFAQRTANHANGRSADFTDASQSLPGVRNEIARVVEQGILKFEDNTETRFYDAVNPDYRYKFFTYFADSVGVAGGKRELAGPLEYSRSAVRTHLSGVDGSQDVMVGFAYHTESEIDSRLQALKRNGYANSDFTKMIADFRDDVIYSNTSARGGLHPVLHLKHVMTRFDVKVRGCRSAATPKVPAYRNVVITNVSLEAPTSGTLTVADDSWKDMASFEAAYKNHQVFAPDYNGREFIPIPLLEQTMTSGQQSDYNFYLENIKQHYDKHGDKFAWPWDDGAEKLWWHVNSEKYQAMNDGHFVVPNCPSYQLKLSYYFVRREWDHNTNQATGFLEDEDNPLMVDGDGNPLITAVFRLAPTPPTKFEQGKRYSISLDIYGPQLINVNVKALDKWEDGGNVNIDVDD